MLHSASDRFSHGADDSRSRLLRDRECKPPEPLRDRDRACDRVLGGRGSSGRAPSSGGRRKLGTMGFRFLRRFRILPGFRINVRKSGVSIGRPAVTRYVPVHGSRHARMSIAAFRASIAVSFFALALAGAAVAGPLDDAIAAYRHGDYPTALRLLQPLANGGDARAQYGLGVMYGMGHGVPQDYAEAMKWYRNAADQGDADAQYNLGVMYDYGHGVPQDYAEAMKWYLRAADQGDADAQHRVGVHYDKGTGVPQDYAEAVKWYRRAADQGDARAQNNLGDMYAAGTGVPQDYVQAYKWYSLAASRYAASETELRDAAIKNRDSVASNMTPQQIVQAQKLAREWKPR
jgi:TPR repeat protein